MDHAQRPLSHRLFRRGAHDVLIHAVGIAHWVDAELAEVAVQEPVDAAIEGATVQHRIAGLEIGHQHGGHRRHARSEHRARLRPVDGGEARLDHVEIGVAQPRIDVARLLAAGHGRAFEEVGVRVLGELGAGIDEGRRQIDRRLGGPRRRRGIVSRADRKGVEAEARVGRMAHLDTAFSAGFFLRPPPRKSKALLQYQLRKRRTSTSASDEYGPGR